MSETTGNRKISMHATSKPFHIENRYGRRVCLMGAE